MIGMRFRCSKQVTMQWHNVNRANLSSLYSEALRRLIAKIQGRGWIRSNPVQPQGLPLNRASIATIRTMSAAINTIADQTGSRWQTKERQ